MMDTEFEVHERRRGTSRRVRTGGCDGATAPKTDREPLRDEGDLVVEEDAGTHRLQARYCRVLGSVIVAVGLIALLGGLSTLVLVDEEDLEGRPAPVIAYSVGTVGFFLAMVGPYYVSKGMNMERHRFYSTGISFSVRSRHTGWTMEHRTWGEMGRFHRGGQWYIGPAIVIDVGIPGDSLIVPGSMEGFDRVEDLVSRNLEEASGSWELFD